MATSAHQNAHFVAPPASREAWPAKKPPRVAAGGRATRARKNHLWHFVFPSSLRLGRHFHTTATDDHLQPREDQARQRPNEGGGATRSTRKASTCSAFERRSTKKPSAAGTVPKLKPFRPGRERGQVQVSRIVPACLGRGRLRAASHRRKSRDGRALHRSTPSAAQPPQETKRPRQEGTPLVPPENRCFHGICSGLPRFAGVCRGGELRNLSQTPRGSRWVPGTLIYRFSVSGVSFPRVPSFRAGVFMAAGPSTWVPRAMGVSVRS